LAKSRNFRSLKNIKKIKTIRYFILFLNFDLAQGGASASVAWLRTCLCVCVYLLNSRELQILLRPWDFGYSVVSMLPLVIKSAP